MVKVSDILEQGIFSGIPAEDLQPFIALGAQRSLASGQYLFRLGEPAKSLGIVTSGGIALKIALEILGEPKEITIETLSSGETLAWSALVDPFLLTLSAVAVEDSTVVEFDGISFLQLCNRVPKTGLQICHNLNKLIGGRLLQFQTLWGRELQRSISSKHG